VKTGHLNVSVLLVVKIPKAFRAPVCLLIVYISVSSCSQLRLLTCTVSYAHYLLCPHPGGIKR